MQFCLIDSDDAYREKLKYHLEVEWPDAGFIEFEYATSTSPSKETLADCDAILIGCPQAGKSGFAGLERLFDRGGYPPVLLFAAGGNELLAVDALTAGAASYFPKDSVSHQRLIGVLRDALGAPKKLSSGAIAGTHGQYRFIEEVHSTDLATIYRAESIDDGRELAIKLIRYVPDSGGERLFDRFLQEYEIIAGIDHPNVVRIFDLGVADDHAFIAMELLANGRLSDRLGRALPPPQAVEYLAQIGGALGAVHDTGILHRDLKPANIMFRDDGSVVLIDFGLAKWMKLEAALTGQGQIFGTPYYMSPEQGHAELTDERADLYSLGCVFYEMLTGLRPYTSSTAMGVIYLHANAARPKLVPELAAYQPLLDRLMAIKPEDRFATAADLLAAIEARTDPAARSILRGA
jgi:serine/threonine protein kinase